MIGASAVAATAVGVVAAAAGRSAVGDNLAVAVLTLWRSAGVGATTVRLGWELSSSTVGTVIGAATCGFIVTGPGWRRLVDSVVDPHEVGVFSELGDDLSSSHALNLACERCDRHEAFLRGSVYSALNRLESFRKVADGEVVAEASATLAALPVMLTSSVSVYRGLVCWSISRELVGGDVFKVLVLGCPRRSWGVASSHEDLAIGGAKAGLRRRHLSWCA
jgi:hypothetical protein